MNTPTEPNTPDPDNIPQDPDALRREVVQLRQTVTQLERRQKIDELLAESETVDVGLARLLTEAAIEMMEQPDLRLAVEDLRRSKPYLFRERPTRRAMSARATESPATAVDHAAERAMETGLRRDLLSYLRLRRG